MLVVAALGGNALARRGESLDIETQRANARIAALSIAELARHDWVVVTHGNGPQVGLLALQAASYDGAKPFPLDVLGAESEGMIGYLIEQELGRLVCANRVVTLLTQVVVDQHDPAFKNPTKPVGPVYDTGEAFEALAAARGWAVAPDGRGVRRVVASPEPLEIVELAAIRALVSSGFTVICTGGGGIPVVSDAAGALTGIEAVVDKDLASALLAAKLRADVLLLLTDVDGVYEGFGTPSARRIARAGADELRSLGLPAGSMGPKAEAACRFAESCGRAAIGALADAGALLSGTAGTQVVAGSHPVSLAA